MHVGKATPWKPEACKSRASAWRPGLLHLLAFLVLLVVKLTRPQTSRDGNPPSEILEVGVFGPGPQLFLHDLVPHFAKNDLADST